MSGFLPFGGVLAGFGIGYLVFTFVHLPAEWAHYLSLATLAGLDTVLGGVRAGIEGRFQDDIFVSGFMLNTLLAIAMSALGDAIGADLFLAAVLALGTRVFLNLSLIRRYYLTRAALGSRKE